MCIYLGLFPKYSFISKRKVKHVHASFLYRTKNQVVNMIKNKDTITQNVIHRASYHISCSFSGVKTKSNPVFHCVVYYIK